MPDIIGKVIRRNANCVTGLRECLHLYDQLVAEHERTQEHLATVTQEKQTLQKLLLEARERHDQVLRTVAEVESNARNEVLAATELAEKQNGLIVTLEAKVSELPFFLNLISVSLHTCVGNVVVSV